jgi:hypothetical protein
MRKRSVKRIEKGLPGHYILAHRCDFRRHTLLESGPEKVIVSTVGHLMNKDRDKVDKIGHDRYYETMAFGVSQEPCGCYTICPSEQIDFSSNWMIDNKDGYHSEADEMHEAVVAELTEVLASRKPLKRM